MRLDLETPMLWIGFLAFIAAMIAIDLGVFHRKTRHVSFAEATVWTGVWATLAMIFAGIVYVLPGYGPSASINFVTGYLLELALSIDNLFVFVLIFGRGFSVPAAYQHRVLVWGILGAVVLRGTFILAGTTLVGHFHWVLYIFGAILLWTGGKLLLSGGEDEDPDLEKSRTVRLARRVLRGRMTAGYVKDRFFTIENGVWVATPLLLVLIVIELSDVVFALDSIPAIFGVTTDSFVVFTSNMFAILGLRSIFFLLNNLIEYFRFLKIGVALVLVFIALKVLTEELLVHLGWPLPIAVSLGVVATLLAGSILLSWLLPEKKKDEPEGAPKEPGPAQDPESPA